MLRMTTVEVCPSCGQNEIDTASGFCTGCVIEKAVDRYAREDERRADARIHRWQISSLRSQNVVSKSRMRKRRSRLLELIRPTQPMLFVVDPWELAAGAIHTLRRYQQLRNAPRQELEDVIETVRRLAWGPSETEQWTYRMRRPPRNYPGQLQLWEEQEVAA